MVSRSLPATNYPAAPVPDACGPLAGRLTCWLSCLCRQAMLLRASRSIRSAPSAALRSGAMRRMCTAVVEEAEAAGPFSPSKPHNQMMYAICGVTYLFALKWQSADRKLAKEIAAFKAEQAEAAPAVVCAPLRLLGGRCCARPWPSRVRGECARRREHPPTLRCVCVCVVVQCPVLSLRRRLRLQLRRSLPQRQRPQHRRRWWLRWRPRR